MVYFSQCQQDKYLNENIFVGIENGIFLDIGAHDGISLSNTYFFEKYKNWTGICVEPIPEVFEKLLSNRKCTCVNACVSHYTGKTMFKQIEGYSEMLSHQLDYRDLRHERRIENEINIYGGNIKLIEIDCYTLEDLLKNYSLNKIDYCSLDIEGGEFEILKTINYNLVDIDVFSVENNYLGNKLREFMESVGYKLIDVLDWDEIYK
jgi:FkbM family methyltransferase